MLGQVYASQETIEKVYSSNNRGVRKSPTAMPRRQLAPGHALTYGRVMYGLPLVDRDVSPPLTTCADTGR